MLTISEIVKRQRTSNRTVSRWIKAPRNPLPNTI